MEFKVYHDAFKWNNHDDLLKFRLSSGFYADIKQATINGSFCVGIITSLDNELLNKNMQYGVIHLPSSSLLTLWESEYEGQVYADTIRRMKEDWHLDRITFNTPFEYALFQSLPRLVYISLNSGIKPLDEDIQKFGNKYIN